MTFTAGNLFPLIHALSDLSQTPTGIRTQVPSLRGGQLTKSAILPPFQLSKWLLQVIIKLLKLVIACILSSNYIQSQAIWLVIFLPLVYIFIRVSDF